MEGDYPSSNPFRRKPPTVTSPEQTADVIEYRQVLADSSNLPAKKPPKKVRVQSPPTSPLGKDLFQNASVLQAEEDDDDDNPFESSSLKTSNDEPRISQAAPANPFATTLATMERQESELPVGTTKTARPGRASMDVEAFKRLLMTGQSSIEAGPPPNISLIQVQGGGDSTDSSSMSKQSISFDSIPEIIQETPRTSHDEVDDERIAVSSEYVSAKRKPPPPSSRHGKLIKVELRDEPGFPAPTPSSTFSEQSSIPITTKRSATDLNKPLPPAPSRSSHDSDRESIFDKESAGKTPEPPSPSVSIRRKTPPAPPLARRHSQLVTDSKSRRGSGRLSPKEEEEDVRFGIEDFELGRRKSIAISELGRSSTVSGKAPPLPPTRKVGSVRRTIRDPQNNPLVSPSSLSLPPPTPPPARGNTRSSSDGRPASVMSFDMGTTKRSMAPPPPPPRHGKVSMHEEDPRKLSGEIRRSSGDSMRSAPRTSDAETAADSKDILADITRLQLEIDALREAEKST